MSVQKMKAVSVVGRLSKLDAVIETCLTLDYFHAESALDVLNSTYGFSKISASGNAAAKFEKINSLFKQFGIPTDDLLSEPGHLSDENIDRKLEEIEVALSGAQKKRAVLTNEIAELNESVEHLKHFESLDIDLGALFDCEFVKVRFGRLPIDSYAKFMHHQSDDVMFYETSHDDMYCWGMYVTPVRKAKETDRIFASLLFEKTIVPDNVGTPEEIIEGYRKEIAEKQAEIEECDKVINDYFVTHEKECRALYSQLKSECEMESVRQMACAYNNMFMLVGWIPKSKADEFQKAVSHLKRIYVEISEPEEMPSFTPPTKLKNSFLFQPFQFYVEIYGTPSYKELDPTVFVAITYTLLYGIMFADLGQGIVLAITGFLMWKIKKMELGKILVPCGIAGAFFGVLFGSVFGYEHWLDPLYKAVGFSKKPIEVMDSATSLLALSVGIGVVLLIVAMILGVVSNFKKKEIGAALFSANGLAGVVLYVGIIAVAAASLLKINIPIFPLTLVMIIIPVISLNICTPLCSLIDGKGFKVENVGDYILETVFEILETLLSFFSNTVSFLRVGAFVLIHAGMMLAFTSLAEIIGGGVGGAIMMIFGNAFVIVLEGLLVGIQVLRLEFYEMFSHFYDGDGKKFVPLASLVKDK